jgi:hypothetical protein
MYGQSMAVHWLISKNINFNGHLHFLEHIFLNSANNPEIELIGKNVGTALLSWAVLKIY